MNNNDYFCNSCNLNTRVDFNNPKQKNGLLEQLRCHSFFVAKNHGVNISYLDDIYRRWIQFFSGNEKFSWLRDESTDEGFVPIGVERSEFSNKFDQKEFYASHTFGKFPSTVDMKSTLKLIDSLILFSEEVIKILNKNILAINLEEIISEKKNHMLRIIHYPPQKESDNYEGAHAHTDACLFTVMPLATCEGLEFLDSNNNWIKPKMNSNEIIFFNSDMIDLLTNGYLKSAYHKVSSPKNNILSLSRYSLPFFIHPNRNIFLNKELTAYEFLKYRLSKIGYDGEKLINSDTTIKTN